MDTRQLSGMNTHYRYYDLDFFFSSAQNNKLNSVELWLCPQHFFVNNVYYESPTKLLDLMERHQVSIDCLCPESNNPKPSNIAARCPEIISNTKHYYKNVFEIAKDIDCHQVLITPGWNYYDEEPTEARKRSIRMIKYLCDLAGEYDITLTLESIWNKSSQVAPTIDCIGEIIKSVERSNLRLTLDLGALAAAGERVADWFMAFGSEMINHCHFVDGNPTGHKSWGRGERDMLMDLSAFSANGYKGKFSFEFVDPACFRTPEQEDRRSIEIFQKTLERMEKNYD